MESTKVKPVVLYDAAVSLGENAMVKLGNVFRITTSILRVSGEIGEFETKDYIYKRKKINA